MTFTLALGLLATGCKREKIDFQGGGSEQDEMGYLILSGMNLDVNVDAEVRETRVATAAPGSYLVSIINVSTQKEAYYGTYDDVQSLTEPLALPAGTYKIEARSQVSEPWAEFDKPVYKGSVEKTIESGKSTEVRDLVCKLANIKTTVYLDDALKAMFLEDGTNDVKTYVSLGDNTLRFTKDETRAGYFKAVEETNTLTINLQGSYNAGTAAAPDYKPVSMTKTISGVRAGQWRKIAISIKHSDEGSVSFDITVQNWVDDEQIDVDVMSGAYTFGEEVIPDEGGDEPNPATGLSIVWEGKDIKQRYPTSELTGDGCVIIKVHSDKGIQDFTVKISGDVLSAQDLEGLGLAQEMNLINPATEEMNGMLLNLGFKTRDDVKDAHDLTFDISQFMPMLTALGIPGNCDFELTVKDSDEPEGTVVETIMLNVQ